MKKILIPAKIAVSNSRVLVIEILPESIITAKLMQIPGMSINSIVIIEARYFPMSTVPREMLFDSVIARVRRSFSPETESNVKRKTVKLIRMVTMNSQFSSLNTLRSGFELPLLILNPYTANAEYGKLLGI